MKLHRDLDISQKAAWFMSHRIKAAMNGKKGLFEGPVEVDETYVGGVEKNRKKYKKQKKGRGTVGKAIVAGIKDRKTNQIKVQLIKDIKKETLHDFVNENVDDDAPKYTDELKSYKGLKNHQAVNHSICKWVDEIVHINGMESFWAMFREGFMARTTQ